MTDDTKSYELAAPDFGGLHGRFADLYARRPASRWHHTAAIVAGAVSGLVVAWGIS